MSRSQVIESASVEATLVIEMACDQCTLTPRQGAHGDVFLEMAPGPNGAPWYLCANCWFDGLFPNNPRSTLSARVVDNGCPTP